MTIADQFFIDVSTTSPTVFCKTRDKRDVTDIKGTKCAK